MMRNWCRWTDGEGKDWIEKEERWGGGFMGKKSKDHRCYSTLHTIFRPEPKWTTICLTLELTPLRSIELHVSACAVGLESN